MAVVHSLLPIEQYALDFIRLCFGKFVENPALASGMDRALCILTAAYDFVSCIWIFEESTCSAIIKHWNVNILWTFMCKSQNITLYHSIPVYLLLASFFSSSILR